MSRPLLAAGILVFIGLFIWGGMAVERTADRESQERAAESASSTAMRQNASRASSTAIFTTSTESLDASSTAAGSILEIGSAKIRFETATTVAAQEHGLSDRASLAADAGLLFIFPQPDYIGIWMKDMNFPIDVIWLDSTMKVIYIVPNMTPESYPKVYTPTSPAAYVLEVNAGVAARENIKIGDQAKIIPGV
jgi:uncharacterized membrane protein (UPF0127 family)